MRDDLLKILYESFDRELSPAEEKSLSAALDTDTELRAAKTEMESLRSKVSESAEGLAFKPGFTRNVLDQVFETGTETAHRETFLESMQTAFFRVAAGAVFACLILVFMNVYYGSSTAGSTASVNGTGSMDEMYQQLSYSVLEEVL